MGKLGVWFLWVCALYMACPRAVLSLLGSWNSGRDMDVPVHDVSVSGSEEHCV
jgi:hypothetical protein